MAGAFVLEVVKRDLTKKAKFLRKEGFLPAEVYGPGHENIHLSVAQSEFEAVLEKVTPASLIQLKMDDGNAVTVFLKTIQRHKLTDKPIHADFYIPAKGHKMTLDIPLKITGTAKGVIKGGVLDVSFHEIPVEIMPKDVVDSIELDITDLEILDKILVSDLKAKLPEGTEILLDSEETVISVIKRAAEVEEEEETTETPETTVEGTEE